jgi:hypothetical protein
MTKIESEFINHPQQSTGVGTTAHMSRQSEVLQNNPIPVGVEESDYSYTPSLV